MEIPLELMLTISQKLPWMFFPDIIPVGHPIFDIINSTNPEVKVLLYVVGSFFLFFLFCLYFPNISSLPLTDRLGPKVGMPSFVCL